MSIELPAIHLGYIAPEIVVTVTACAILLLDFFFDKLPRVNITLAAVAGLLAAVYSANGLVDASGTGFSDMMIRDNMSAFLELVFLKGAILVVLISHRYAERHGIPYAEHVMLILFSTLGMMIVAISADLIMVFLGIELLSLSLFVLAGLNKNSLLSGEASLKYFLLGAFSTGFFVFGLAFIFGICRTTNLIAIGSSAEAGMAVPPLLLLGFGLVLVGIGFKISLAPFHMWAPDVYQGAPTPVTAWIATGSKIAGFAALLRIFSMPGTSFAPLSDYWTGGIWVLALVTMVIGNLGALAQTDIKRMLAYSSIAHGGYLSMAFVAHNEIGVSAILFYMYAYLLMSIGAFGVVALVDRPGEECKSIDDLSGLYRRKPFIAALMALFMLSLAGMPPTAGFFGKLWLFGAAIQAQYYGLALAGIVTTLLSFYYYLRVIVCMYMRGDEGVPAHEPTAFSNGLALWASAFGVIYLGVFPGYWWGYISGLF